MAKKKVSTSTRVANASMQDVFQAVRDQQDIEDIWEITDDIDARYGLTINRYPELARAFVALRNQIVGDTIRCMVKQGVLRMDSEGKVWLGVRH